MRSRQNSTQHQLNQSLALLETAVDEIMIRRRQDEKVRNQQRAAEVRRSIEKLLDVELSGLDDQTIFQIQDHVSNLMLDTGSMLRNSGVSEETVTRVLDTMLSRGEAPDVLPDYVLEQAKDQAKQIVSDMVERHLAAQQQQYKLVGLEHAGYVNTPAYVKADQDVTYAQVPPAGLIDFERVCISAPFSREALNKTEMTDAELRDVMLNPKLWPDFYSSKPQCGALGTSEAEAIQRMGIKDPCEFVGGYVIVALTNGSTIKAALAMDSEDLLKAGATTFGSAQVQEGDQIKLVNRLYFRMRYARAVAQELSGSKAKRGQLTTDFKKLVGGASHGA